ncbi:hypothetical protein P3T76_007030 [Phytophthora citrophthora]|uniref:Uncharacterized protein n=1 Tax=Phytophthora citrophthora TaxID=4793 RepID=A0AAD9GMK0_9STRA|nr:hypothetical protein P3T76_007030 [Phytophthora citrophthora]
MIGSPGIGKSVFGVFLLLLFMSEHKNVAYRPLHGVNKLHYFTWDANKNCYKVSLKPVSGHFYEGLFDGNYDGNASYRAGFEHSYLFASPRTDNYNEFVKEGCVTIYMNPWTAEECHKYVDKVSLDYRIEWLARFNLVGGKPRFLFSNSSLLEGLIAALRSAIPAFENPKTVIKNVQEGNRFDLLNHILFVLFRDERTPKGYAIKFASEEIECLVNAACNTA